MRRWLFTTLLRLPYFKGKTRLIQSLRHNFTHLQCRLKHGFEMELDCREWAQLYLAQYQELEPQTSGLVARLLKEGDAYIDVGAHVGYLTLVARTGVGSSGKVIAIEPQPYNCEKLLRNWEINGYFNLQLLVAAAGTSGGLVSLPQQAANDKSRLSLILPMPHATSLTFTVPILSLSELIERTATTEICLLKLDVGGCECDVLRSLGSHFPIVRNIIVEVLGSSAEDDSRSRLTCELLKEKGYSLSNLDGSPWNGSFPVTENNIWAARKG
jgi:FkbM family methyltransferase